MPRPRKCRRICRMPEHTCFGAENASGGMAEMSIDEYEVIRLIDLEGLSQEEAAQSMNVARTTVQAIYAAARGKLADCLVNGKYLVISGGDVQLCDRGEGGCPHRRCCRRGKPDVE